MKTHSILAIILSLLATMSRPALAQTATANQWSGQITYEVVRKVDLNSTRIIINGEQVKPGDPNFPADVPDTRTFSQKLLVSGNFAKINRDEEGMVVRTMVGFGGGGGAPQTTNLGRPFEEQVFLDLNGQKTITMLTIGKDKDAKSYRAEMPLQRASDWQLTDQTKKIAGFACRKATVPFRKETYTVWFTTELPFTYSPIQELTPEAGTVLLIESSREQFRATKVSASAVDAKEVQPITTAETVTAAQLADLRQKATADFRQQLMTGERN
ncbi:GLPGLI family protein [Spirosoma endbachense]|uniref:GLPGLI family protein n=1 Tax=Spirosoma endbachense TaxID=2666025 RepID=A0A6P1W736_9BACT|nr:GLPGLI family protein [Spirosoma endbachense]QHW00826.1 GLPGLI family protein [Spirosoma endbachense]